MVVAEAEEADAEEDALLHHHHHLHHPHHVEEVSSTTTSICLLTYNRIFHMSLFLQLSKRDYHMVFRYLSKTFGYFYFA